MRVKSKNSADRRRRTPEKTGPGKDLGNFKGFTLSRISAHFHAAGTGYSTATYDPISAFLPSRLFEWIPQVAKYWFHKKHAFRDYTTHGKGTGIYLIDDRVKISIAGDWGTGTDEARIVAAAMENPRRISRFIWEMSITWATAMKCEKTSWGRKRVPMHR